MVANLLHTHMHTGSHKCKKHNTVMYCDKNSTL